MNRKLSYFLIALGLVLALFIPVAAQLGIGTNNPDPSAALDIVSTNQGVLPPRLTTAQRDAISSPAEGLTIYNSTDKCLQVWDGAAWKCAVGSSGSGNNNTGVTANGGGIPTTTDAAMPLISVADGPDAQLWGTRQRNLWLDSTHIATMYPIVTTGVGTTRLRIFDDNLRLLSEYAYPSFYPYRIITDTTNSLMIFGNNANNNGGITHYMVVNPTTGAVVKTATALPTPNVQDFQGYTSIDNGSSGTLHVRGDDGSLFLWGITINSLNWVLTKFDGNMNIIKTLVIPNATTGALWTPVANGIMVFQKPSGGQKTYTIYNYELTQVASGTLFTDPNSLFYGTDYQWTAIREANSIYFLSTGGTPSSTNVVGKYNLSDAGTLTKVWEVTLPYPNANYNSMWMFTNVQGHLAIFADPNSAPFNTVPTGFYHDGTLAMGGKVIPYVLLDKSTGAYVKTLMFGSPAYTTKYGTTAQATFNPGDLLTSPSGHRLLHIFGPNDNAGTFTEILDATTLASTYSLTNDSVERSIGRRFMVYDFNNNINKVEMQLTDGQLGDVLGIDGAFTLPSGMAKSYSFSQKRLTITGAPNNTSDNFRDALNAVVFSTDAATGSRSVQLKIYDADGMVNTTNFAINVQ